MPEEIALLPHLQWAKNYINAIYTADSYEAATLMLDSFLSKKATVVINGVETSRSDAINRMNGHLQPQRGVLVNFIDTIDSQEDSNLGDWGKALALFFTVKYGVQGSGIPAVTRVENFSMNLVVANDSDITMPTGRLRYFDGRRVMAMNYVSRISGTP